MYRFENYSLYVAFFKPLTERSKKLFVIWNEISLYKYIRDTNTFVSNKIIRNINHILIVIKAINNQPKPHLFIMFTLKGQISNFYEKSDTSTNMLSVFNIKLKKDDVSKKKLENNKNFAGKAKHYPPANKEWFNSVYAYNKNAIKLLPITDQVILKLVKSYLNIYSRKLENKTRSRRLRIRVRRLSTNRILVSRPELKHTNDKVIVTVYVYNRQKKYYLNKIKRIASIDQIDNFLPNSIKKQLKESNGLLPSNLKMEIIRNKGLKLKSKIKNHKNLVLKMLNIKKADHNKFHNYEVRYLKDYVSKSLRREIFSIYFKQLISFNKSKFETKYLLPLTNLAKKIYSKEIVFNLVSLKYLYLNSYIFSEALVTKLKNRKNRLLRVLKTSLLMFKLPAMDRTAVYDEIYNRKRKLQNLKVENIVSDFLHLNNKAQSQNKDILELSLSKVNSSDFYTKLKDFTVSWPRSLTYSDYPLHIANNILKLIKHKYVSGIRIEVGGRLTRRNTADRSVFKLRYKGNIKNMDSSYKGLPSVLLRGYAKPNLQYTKLKSKIRIGSFGLKGWVNSS